MNRPIAWAHAAAAALVLCVTASTARAQSAFALTHLGQRIGSGDARSIALGGEHVAVPDSLGVLQENPAMLAWIDRVTVGISARGVSVINRSPDASDREGAVTVPAVGVGFTVRRAVRVGLGYRARTTARAAFSSPRTAPDGTPYVERFARSGGLFAVPLSVAAPLGSRVRLGAYASYEVGALEESWVIDFDPGAGLDAASRRRREFRGTGWGVGAALRAHPGVFLAASYDARVDYDVDGTVRNTNSNADTSWTDSALLPARWSATVRVSPTRTTAITLSGATRDMRRASGAAAPDGEAKREWIVSAGYEQRGAFRAMPLRVSASVEQLPWTLGGRAIRRVALAVGTSWRPPGRRAKIDATLFVARTGSRSDNGLETSSVGLVLGLSGSEVWSHHREDL